MSLQPLLKKTFRTHIISRYCNKTCTVCFSVLCTLCITKRVLNAKCIRMRLTIGFLPDPVGKFTALPQTLSWIKEEEPKRMEWKEKWGRKRERKKMEGRLILNAFSSIGLCYIVTVKSDEVNGVRLKQQQSIIYSVILSWLLSQTATCGWEIVMSGCHCSLSSSSSRAIVSCR